MRQESDLSAELLLYQNREALPRAFVVNEARVITDPQRRLLALAAATRAELAKVVLLTREAEKYLEAGQVGARGGAALDFRRPGEEIYWVNSQGPGLLFVSNQYYPGWRAFVHDREVPIFRANHCFRAIPVPEGKSVVRMVFAPASVRLGLAASGATLLALLALSYILSRHGGQGTKS
jgi:hypothetical protein